MQQNVINKIARQVSQQFPEVKGVAPQVREQNSALAKGMRSTPTYLLTFSTQTSNILGKSVPRIVRVTATDSGEIIKISTSR